MKKFKLHQRVLTSTYGEGNIVGFEHFDSYGNSGPLLDHELEFESEHSAGRIVVQLDDPSQWVGGSAEFPHPYMFRHEIKGVSDG